MNITPGITLAPDEEITTDKLNLLGTPTVALDEGAKQEIAEDLQTRLGNGVVRLNYFTNPGLDQWTRGTGPVQCSPGERRELANDWWVRCNAATGDAPTYSRVSAPNGSWIYAAKVEGRTGVGSCDFGQDLAPHVAAALAPRITVTFDLFNATGAALTPEVRLDTCDAAGNYDAVTNRVSAMAAVSVANNTLQTLTVTLETAGFETQLRNGAQLYIRVPSPALGSDTAYVHIQALKVEIGATATARYTERELTPTVSESGGSGGEAGTGGWLRNADFSRWLRGSVTCVEDEDNYAAEAWGVNPADGDTLVYARSTNVPGTKALYSVELTGGADVTAQVDISQEIPAVVAANLRRLLVFSADVYNGTGADFQPVLRLDTCNAADNFSSVTNRVSTTASTCANGQWTRVEFSFDGESVTNMANGAKMIIRIPGGSLDSHTKVVRIAQAKLEVGATATAWDVAPFTGPVLAAPMVRGLQASCSDTNIISITADEVILNEPGGGAIRVRDFTASVNNGTTGAGGIDKIPSPLPTGAFICYVWLISTGTTHSAVISLSATAPVIPAGYQYRARVGAVAQSPYGVFQRFWQRDGTVFIQPNTEFSGTVTSAGAYQAVTLSRVPVEAVSALLEVQLLSSGALKCLIRKTGTTFGGRQILVAQGVSSPMNAVYASVRTEVPVTNMSGKAQVDFSAESASLNYAIETVGYRLW